MKFSLRLNNDRPAAEYVILARAAEAAGFSQFWVSNDLFLRGAIPILTQVALSTEHIEVGSGILNPYTIHPAEIAMMAATMDEISGGRFLLGLGAGAGDFLSWVGIEQSRPLTQTRLSLIAIRRLLDCQKADGETPFAPWTEKAFLRFEPVRRTPIYIGAMGPRMLALCGELADGALPLLFPPEHYFHVRPLIDKGLKERPADLGTLDLAACFWISLSKDPRAARRALAEKVAYYGHALSPLILAQLGVAREEFGPIQHALQVEQKPEKAFDLVNDRMLRIGIAGEPEEVIERLEPLVAAGATHLSFGPPLGPDPLEAVNLLGDVLAHFS